MTTAQREVITRYQHTYRTAGVTYLDDGTVSLRFLAGDNAGMSFWCRLIVEPGGSAHHESDRKE